MRAALSAAANAHRRKPRDVRLLPGLSLYLGATREEARQLFMDTHRRVDRAQRIARLLEGTGLDLRDWPGDRRVRLADLPTGQLHRRPRLPMLQQIVAADEPQVDDLLARPEMLASVHWQVIGTVDDAIAEITRWFTAGAVDGFVAVPGGSRQSLDITLGELVPRLAEAGLFRSEYTGDTFLHHLEQD
jgi:alkanesulfonate monooxygenase SsuD/methylene tetrahydromethanopterin reductase-like flavin-dependent oxidoreductase (luciferase family)